MTTRLKDTFAGFEEICSVLRPLEPYLRYLLTPLCLYGAYRFACRFVPGPRRLGQLNLNGRTVVITGASGGLGKALAYEFYKRGAKLILSARQDLNPIIDQLVRDGAAKNWNNPHKPVGRYLDLSAINQTEEPGGCAIFQLLDVSARLTLIEEFDALGDEKVDVLVHNAGLSNRGSCVDTNMSTQRRVMEVNFFGAVALTRAALPHIPADGAIVFIGSLQSLVALPYRSAYSASKHAMQAFCDSLRCEDPQHHVLTVNPGYINTDFGKTAVGPDGEPVGKVDEHHLSGMAPEEVARHIVDALVRRQSQLIIAPLKHRIIMWMRLLTPNLLWWILHVRGRAERKKQTKLLNSTLADEKHHH